MAKIKQTAKKSVSGAQLAAAKKVIRKKLSAKRSTLKKTVPRVEAVKKKRRFRPVIFL